VLASPFGARNSTQAWVWIRRWPHLGLTIATARRRAQLESEAEADTLKQLEAEVKKLPAAKKSKRPQS
jgi:aryl-alcohol dehydrogenase-like predicted oxidoreductase